MCGITGFFNIPFLENKADLDSLSEIISYRGPDDINQININNLYLIFSRLSIIDLSNNAMQPMTSYSTNSVMLFNGEIYNYKEIKKELLKKNIIDNKCISDSRILIEGLEHHGMDFLKKIKGMFSIFYFDKKNKTIFLINDRFGEKPLYYSLSNSDFFFSSDIKSFSFKKRYINKKGLKTFFSKNCFSYPDTIWKDVERIKPGTYLKFKVNFENNTISDPSLNHYWSPKIFIKPFSDSIDKAVDKLDFLLSEVIERQINADVEVGTFLSGGIDSSLITSIAQKVSKKKISSFSIGFEDSKFDESIYAEKIAKHLGTNHRTKIMSKDDINNIFDTIIDTYGEPYSDSSQIPTILLSQFSSQYLKVVLTGDGGDELFGGYDRYTFVNKIWRYLDFFPLFLRNQIKLLFEYSSPYSYNFFSTLIKLIFTKYRKTNFLNSKLRNLVISLSSNNPVELAEKLSSHFSHDFNLLFRDFNSNSNSTYQYDKNYSIAENIMLHDVQNYLPNDLLVKTDRASMRYGLEARMPFLDEHIYKFSRSLPLSYKLKGDQSKIILKKLLNRYIPSELFERPKQGFLVPLNDVLQNKITDIEKILNEDLIRKQGILNPEVVSNELNQFKSGNTFNIYNLWDIINFQMWVNKNLKNIAQ